MVLFGATKGYLDKVDVPDVVDFTEGAVKEISPDTLKKIKDAGSLDDKLNNELHDFYKQYVSSHV